MTVTRRQQVNPIGDGLPVHADWQSGARTLAWDALWQRILAEVLPKLVEQDSLEPSSESGQATAQLPRGGHPFAGEHGPACEEE
jgi:hypothetical protein